MKHEDFIAQIDKLQSDLNTEVTSLELTPDEQIMIDRLPKQKRMLITALLSRYQPIELSADIREKIVLKGLAILLLHAEPVLRKAWDTGQKLGQAQKAAL